MDEKLIELVRKCEKLYDMSNKKYIESFTVHFDSLSFIHTNSCTFSYNYVSVF